MQRRDRAVVSSEQKQTAVRADLPERREPLTVLHHGDGGCVLESRYAAGRLRTVGALRACAGGSALAACEHHERGTYRGCPDRPKARVRGHVILEGKGRRLRRVLLNLPPAVSRESEPSCGGVGELHCAIVVGGRRLELH